MPTPKNNNNTQQPRQKAPITISGYPEKVKDLLRTKYPDFDNVMGGGQQAMSGSPNGGTPAVGIVAPNMNFFGGGNQAVGKYDAQPVQTGAAQTTDFTQMQQPQQFEPQNEYGNANPTVGPVASPYMGDAADVTPQNQTNFENMPVGQQATGWNPDGSPKYDTLSAALNGSGVSHPQQQVPEFHADPSQRDGGFFGWLSGLIPKNRPGMREGETPDEYDRRITTNRERIAAFADAIRHMANIVNTAKGAPLQQFNDPTAMLEQGYQNRKAQRAQKAAADANAAYKMANMTLKERAAEAADAYKRMSLGYKDSADRRERDKFNYQMAKDAAAAQRQAEQDKQKQSNWENQFRFRQQQAAISNGLRQQSIDKRGSGKSGGGGRGGSGSGNSYPLYNPVTGQTEHFKNEKSWIARANELGYKTDTPSSSTTSQEVYSKDGVKKVSNTTRGNSVAAQIGKQMAQKKAAARNKPKSTQKSGGSGKGHNALNAWFKKNNK